MITFGLIPFNNIERTLDKINNIIVPTIAAYPQHTFETICVDNSSTPLDISHLVTRYHWNGGANTFYAGAMNQIVSMANGNIIVYICTQHGRMLDSGWLQDIVQPIMEGYAMAGDYAIGFIQGGVFAADVGVLRKVPYSLDPSCVHLYSDHYITKALLDNGHRLCHVPTIRSVWRHKVSPVSNYKYVHDE